MNTYTKIQDAAVSLALTAGLARVTRERVADMAELAPSMVNHHFDTMEKLRTRVVEIAIDTRNVELLKCGIYAKHPLAMSAPPDLREKALELLSIEIMGEKNA